MFEKISIVLLERFGIESIVVSEINKNKYNVFLRICNDDSILEFTEKIGVRYCFNKSYMLTAIGSIIRYKQNEERKLNDTKIVSIDIEEYVNSTGLINFCNQENNKKIDRETLPCYEMSVINIEKVGKKHVYDLNVEEPYSNFIAEGIVTHNCNKLPKLRYSDKAVWNRIRVIPFESTFCMDAPEEYEDQLAQKRFKMDKTIGDRLQTMVQVLI